MRHCCFLILLLLVFGACSSADSETAPGEVLGQITADPSQFSNKLAVRSFVSELYGSTNRAVTISHQQDSHIAWIGFVRSNDYKYFKVSKVAVGNNTIVAEGIEREGTVFSPNSSAIIENIDVGASESGDNSFAEGQVDIVGAGDLKITVEYSPLKAVETSTKPHKAYLVVFYDAPKTGSLLIELSGLTQGMRNEKCARAVETLKPVVYAFKSKKFDFYFCGSEVSNKNQNNIRTVYPQPSPKFRDSDFINVTPISAVNDATGEENFLTFYQVDDETVCLLSRDLTGDNASIESFTFPIPEGLAPIDELIINMAEGSFAECSLDAAKNIFCDDTLQVDTGVVPVSSLTATNQTFTADEMLTSECPDFGPLSGAGVFGDTDLTLALRGRMLPDQTTQDYNIVDALVAAELELTCVSGCE